MAFRFISLALLFTACSQLVGFNMVDPVDAPDLPEKQKYLIPYAFSSETTGFAVGSSAILSGYGQP